MDHTKATEGEVAGHQRNSGLGNEGGNESWNAQTSTAESAAYYKQIQLESSPLLGGDHDDGSSGEGSSRSAEIEAEWPGQKDFEGVPWQHKPSIYWLLGPFFLFALAFGGIIVPKLSLILSLVCRRYLAEKSANDPSFIFAPVIAGGDNPQCQQDPDIQKLATKFTLYLTIVAGILSAIMTPKLGSLSDRYGRIRFLVITSAGGFLTEIITILAAKYPDVMDYRWLLAGAVFEGLCGSFTAGMALTHAYASDCTSPSKRAVAFGYFHACLFGGIALGPFIAGLAFRATGSLLVMFYAAIIVHTFFILFISLVVPESLTQERQIQTRETHEAEVEIANRDGHSLLKAMRKGNLLAPIKVLFAPLKILWPTGPGSTAHLRINLVLLSMVDTIIFGTAMGAMTVVVFYSGFVFDWKSDETSFFVSIANTTRVSALIILLPILNYLFRTRPRNKQRRESGFAIPEPNSGCDSLELYIVRLAIVFELLGYGGYATAKTGSMFIAAGVLAAFGGIGSPTLQSALTKHVPHDKVGQLLGATGLLHALARIICPTIFGLIYAGTVDTLPSAVFVVLAAWFGIALLVSWFIRPNVSVPELEHEDSAADGNIARAHESSDILIDEEIAGV